MMTILISVSQYRLPRSYEPIGQIKESKDFIARLAKIHQEIREASCIILSVDKK